MAAPVSIDHKIWSGLAVTAFVALSPVIVGLDFLSFGVAHLFNLVLIAMLGIVLMLVKRPQTFWWAAIPAMVVLGGFYTALRFSMDPQTPIAVLFVPLYAALAAFVGVVVGTGIAAYRGASGNLRER